LNIARRNDVQAIVLAAMGNIANGNGGFDRLRRPGRGTKGLPRMTNNRRDLCGGCRQRSRLTIWGGGSAGWQVLSVSSAATSLGNDE